MDVDLTTIKAILAEPTDAELLALIDAAHKAPQIAPGLLAWIDGACDWESAGDSSPRWRRVRSTTSGQVEVDP